MQTANIPASEVLKTAAVIAELIESRGHQISPTEAVERAIAAQIQIQQFKHFQEQEIDWADTVINPVAVEGWLVEA